MLFDNEVVCVCLFWIGFYVSIVVNKICVNYLNEKVFDEILIKVVFYERIKYKGCNVVICYFVVLVFDEISFGLNVWIEFSLVSWLVYVKSLI